MTGLFVWKIIVDRASIEILPQAIPENLKTLDEVSSLLPQGAYTTFRTYHHNYVLHLGDHLARLENTAALTGHKLLVSVKEIREGLKLAMRKFPENKDSRIRITVPLEQLSTNFFISFEYLKPLPLSDYQNGVKVITCNLQRENPKAKLTNFLEKTAEIKKNMGSNINDAIMIGSDNRIKEGISSNFFAVMNSEIWTEDKDVLSGITRSIVLNEARQARIPVHLEGIRLDQINKIDEAFITSSSRGVLPVRQIDNVLIKTKIPGKITLLLMKLYKSHLERELEEIKSN